MIANEERLALVLEANDKATATLQKVRREIEAARGSTTNLNRATDDYDVSGNKVRRGALAFGAVARAADQAKLGTQGAVSAASELAETLALVTKSARFASWATGIGAAVAVLGTFLSLLQDTEQTIDRVSPAMERLLGDVDVKQAEAFVAGLRAKQARLTAEIEANDATLGEKIKRRFITGNIYTKEGREEILTGNDPAQVKRLRELDQTEQDLKASLEKLADLRRSARQKDRDEAKSHAEQLREQAKKDGLTALDLYVKLNNSRVLAEMEIRGESDAEIQKHQARIDESEQEQAIAKLVFLENAENRRSELIAAARLALAARIAQIENKTQQDAAAKRLDFADRVRSLEEQREAASLRKKQQIVGSLVHNMVEAQGPLVKQLKRLALEPIASELEGLAIREGVKAVTSWPNALAMAKHAAGAAAAIAGAREVYALAGGGGGKGGSSGGGGGASEAGTFEARDNGMGGSQSITLITRDPYGRDQIQRVAWELDRAGVMKRPPTQIPPTTGLSVVR
jgi:hypothetical protein